MFTHTQTDTIRDPTAFHPDLPQGTLSTITEIIRDKREVVLKKVTESYDNFSGNKYAY